MYNATCNKSICNYLLIKVFCRVSGGHVHLPKPPAIIVLTIQKDKNLLREVLHFCVFSQTGVSSMLNFSYGLVSKYLLMLYICIYFKWWQHHVIVFHCHGFQDHSDESEP